VKTLDSPKEPLPVARTMVKHEFSRGTSVLLRHWHGGAWVWRETHWAEMDERELRAKVYAFTEHASYDDGKNVKSWAPNRYKVADVVDALRAVTHLTEAVEPPAWIDEGAHDVSANHLVACRNGLLDIATSRLHEHTPDLFNTVSVPFDYLPAASRPARWLAFLAELFGADTEAITTLQQFFGYVISGRTDLHKILLLLGPTRSGKGTIARVLTALVGKANVTGPTLAGLGTNFGLSDLIGKPLAIISDARLGGRDAATVVERLLSISGEDTLTIDRKYRDPWTGRLSTRFLIISNELPRFGDASGAIARRFVMLNLTETFLGRENPALTTQLLTELPGILNWSLTGLADLTASRAFTEPQSSKEAAVALQDLASPVAAFVRDCCTKGPTEEVGVDTLYAAWRAWCEDNGRERAGTKQTFGRDLRAVIPSIRVVRPRDDDARTRRYVGVALHTPSVVNGESSADNGETRGPARTETEVHTLVRSGPRAEPLSALQTMSPPVGNAVCTVCGQPRLYGPVSIERGICASCWQAGARR
jgi:putative DNA primase/helicase